MVENVFVKVGEGVDVGAVFFSKLVLGRILFFIVMSSMCPDLCWDHI